MSLDQIERQVIEEAIKIYGNDKEEAARVLGVATKTIYNKLAQYAQDDKETKAREEKEIKKQEKINLAARGKDGVGLDELDKAKAELNEKSRKAMEDFRALHK